MENGSKPLRDALRHTRVGRVDGTRTRTRESQWAMLHVPERIPVRALRWAGEGADGSGALRRCCGRTVASGMWDAKGRCRYLTVGLRRGMRGQKAGLDCVVVLDASRRQEALLLKCRGRWVVQW
jgi:hypothetical protein